jgi:hypothetical protein
MNCEIHGVILGTWAMLKTKFQNGVVRHLNDTLRPKIKNDTDALKSATPVPIQSPRPKPAAQ